MKQQSKIKAIETLKSLSGANGSFVSSERSLAFLFGWTRYRTRLLIDELKTEGKLAVISEYKKTTYIFNHTNNCDTFSYVVDFLLDSVVDQAKEKEKTEKETKEKKRTKRKESKEKEKREQRKTINAGEKIFAETEILTQPTTEKKSEKKNPPLPPLSFYSVDQILENIEFMDRKPRLKLVSMDELSFPHTSEKFIKTWDLWMSQPKQLKKPVSAHQLNLDKLGKYDEEFAIELLELAVANNYQGVVFINTNRHYQMWLNDRQRQKQPVQEKQCTANSKSFNDMEELRNIIEKKANLI